MQEPQPPTVTTFSELDEWDQFWQADEKGVASNASKILTKTPLNQTVLLADLSMPGSVRRVPVNASDQSGQVYSFADNDMVVLIKRSTITKS